MVFNDLALTERLLIARRGTAYFAELLAELSDDQFVSDSLLPGWTRGHLVAHVGCNAAALCRLMDWAATGVETAMYASADQRESEIDRGAALSPGALRDLVALTAAQLDEKWRHVPDSAWSSQVRTAQGRLVAASETAWMRTREVWIHGVDLANGGLFDDFPTVILETLLVEITGMWRQKGVGAGLTLTVADRESIVIQPDSVPRTAVIGPLEAVVRWAAGRGTFGVTVSGDIEEPPRWL